MDEISRDDDRRPSRRRAWLTLGALALLLGGLWVATRDDAPPAATPTAASTGWAVGMPAPLHFVVKDLDGADVPLASFKGKTILFNFWATWCEPCRDEIPDLVALHHQYRDKFTVVGMLVLDPVDDQTRPFLDRFEVDYPILDANDRVDVEDAFGPMWGLPTSVLVGPDGRVVARYPGPRTKEQFERDIVRTIGD
jgi:thiol-disulfide isomerase/thioredoxin